MQNDAPKPTPIGKQKLYKIKDNSDSNYKIKLTYCSDKLIIDIEQEDSIELLINIYIRRNPKKW